MKMRIVEEIDQDRKSIFYPEKKVLLFWRRISEPTYAFGYVSSDIIKFNSLISATSYLRKLSPVTTRIIHKF
jgi:hypothetical protein